MICKWCGAEMSRGETLCRRCGKETPALSDCGGFYGLVPRATPQIPVADVASRPARKNGFLIAVCVLLALALAASVFACSVAFRENRNLKNEIEELEERLEEEPGDSAFEEEQELLPIPQPEGADATAEADEATVEADETTEPVLEIEE